MMQPDRVSCQIEPSPRLNRQRKNRTPQLSLSVEIGHLLNSYEKDYV